MSGIPRSASNYQYQSVAVRADNLANVYRKDNTNTFFSFVIVLPILAIIAFSIIIFSNRNSIEEKLKKKEQHKNFAAVIGLGLNIAAYVTIMDILALRWFTDEDPGGREIYFSKEDNKYNTLKVLLILHVGVESLISCLGEIWCIILTLGVFHELSKKHKSWWTLLILFSPTIWCLASHFGFIVIAWSSFVRRGRALTLVYVIGATVMFIVMRETYKLFDKLKDKKGTNEEQGEYEISFWIILVVQLVDIILIGAFFYIMYGLWLVPASETVEDSPVYLYDSLHLIIVVLAVLVSYKISFGDNEVVGKKEIRNEDPTPSPNFNTRAESHIQENDGKDVVEESRDRDDDTHSKSAAESLTPHPIARQSSSTRPKSPNTELKETRRQMSSSSSGDTDTDPLIKLNTESTLH